MKTALVLEGGAMQGMYTAGVLDVMMKAGIKFDAIIGVSAGALFGVNYLSDQPGRVIRYNKKFNPDKEYMGLVPLLKERNVVSTDYAYRMVPRYLDPFDDETFKANPVPFYAVVTNIRTGLPEYIEIKSVFDQMDTLRASGSMPFLSKPVKLGNEYYLDGAVTDSIPFKAMLDMGYDKLVVVLTKDAEYVKKPMNSKLIKLMYGRKHPEFAQRLANRHAMYNKQMEDLMKLQAEGVADVIRPSEALYIKKTERDPERMELLYQLGIKDGTAYLGKINK
ncbi:MAG: patatin family protein [Firmicutes bacterium]|nr:patatin family protein [Bacillota bacterium]